MNKKWNIILLLILCVALFICACGNNGTNESTVPSDNSTGSNTTQSTDASETEGSKPTEDIVSDPTYVVSVVDQNGDPVEGVMLQFCDDTSCKMPEITGADGMVSKTYPESNYHVTVTAPEGYTCDTAEFYFEEGETTLTIELTKN